MIDLDWGWPTERLDLEPLAMAHAGELPPLLDDVSLHEFTDGAPLPAGALVARLRPRPGQFLRLDREVRSERRTPPRAAVCALRSPVIQEALPL